MAKVEFARNEIDEGLYLEIEVELPGWTERVTVPSPARPGAVRSAVAKVLRDLGLTAVRRPTGPAFL